MAEVAKAASSSLNRTKDFPVRLFVCWFVFMLCLELWVSGIVAKFFVRFIIPVELSLGGECNPKDFLVWSVDW